MSGREIGTLQRAALVRLMWRPELAAANDRAFASLERRGYAWPRAAGKGEAEWHITHAGLVAIGAHQPDEWDEGVSARLAAILNARPGTRPTPPLPLERKDLAA